jgi:hypothetical protein
MSKSRLVGVGLLTCLFACSDDDGSTGVCAPVEPCGGEIAGAWQIEALCFPRDRVAQVFENGLPAECAGAFTNADAVVEGGALEYDTNGSRSAAGAARVHAEYRFEERCMATALPDLDARTLDGPFCTSVADRLFAQLTELTPAQGTIACRAGSRRCECELSSALDLTSSGSYSAIDGELVSGAASTPYCISGDSLQYEAALGGVASARRR